MYHSPDVSAVRDNLNLELELEEQIKVQQLRTDLQDNLINSWEERIGSVTAWYNEIEEFLNDRPTYEKIVSHYINSSSREYLEAVRAEGDMLYEEGERITAKVERIKELQEGIKVLVCCSETEEWDEQIKEQEEVIRVQEGRMKLLMQKVSYFSYFVGVVLDRKNCT